MTKFHAEFPSFMPNLLIYWQLRVWHPKLRDVRRSPFWLP